MLYKELPSGYAYRTVRYGPYSPSRLIVAKCPQRFFSRYVRKDRDYGHSVNSARGNAIHHVLAKITQALMAKEVLTPKIVNDWVSESIGLYPAAYSQIEMVKGAADAYISRPNPYMNHGTNCEMALAVRFAEEQSFLDDAVLGRAYVAVPYTLEDGRPNPDVFFGGRLDQITVDEAIKTVTILDHKSTPSANQNADNNFQVGCYAWLASLFWPGYTIQTVIHYAHPDLKFYSVPTIYTQEDLAEIESYMHTKIWAIESMDEFPAIPNNGCDYCTIVQECEENLALLAQQAKGKVDLSVRSFQDLQRLAKELKPLGVLYDQVNQALKNGIELYAPKNGVHLEGVWYGFKASDEAIDWIATDQKIRVESMRAKQLLTDGTLPEEEKARLEKQAALPDLGSILSKYGVKPDSFKEYQSKKLKMLWKLDKPELLQTLKDYLVTDRSTRFGAHKS